MTYLYSSNIEPKIIKTLFDYHDNDLYWKIQPNNNVNIEKPAGSISKKHGYRTIMVNKQNYASHRLVWVWHHGEWPESTIDHIDENKLNNSLYNLRLATHRQNNCNRSKLKTNVSGYKGVSWSSYHKKYQAKIAHKSKQYHLGFFDCPKVAHKVYKAKALQFHGKFANFG